MNDVPAEAFVLTPEEIVKDGAVSITEAATVYGIKRTRLYDLMNAGKLGFIKVGSRRLLPRNELRRVLASGLVIPRKAEATR